MFDTNRSILQKIVLDSLIARSIQLVVKRDDLIDEFVSGNKWRKLKYNVEFAKQGKKEGILTFGGAFSNHLLATAAACSQVGLKSVGLVRGEELNTLSNDTLKRCSEFGMELKFISREEYNLKNEKYYKEELNALYSNIHIVPEGGSNYYGLIGCQEILNETPNNYDHVFVAQGTTTTSAGIALSIPEACILHVVPVLKGFDSLNEMRHLYLQSGFENFMVEEILSKIKVHNSSHFGGYGKYTPELLDFMEDFFRKTKVPLDPIYTGKALFALMDWIEKENIKDANILFVHTGGIQGGKLIAKKEGRTFF